MSDHFDSEINAEEIQDHNPDETCSTCGERVINCKCNWTYPEREDVFEGYGDYDDDQPDLQKEYEDLYGGENEYDYDVHMDWW